MADMKTETQTRIDRLGPPVSLRLPREIFDEYERESEESDIPVSLLIRRDCKLGRTVRQRVGNSDTATAEQSTDD